MSSTKSPARTRAKKKPIPKKKRSPQKDFSFRCLLLGEEKPDLTALESGSTTILDILSPRYY